LLTVTAQVALNPLNVDAVIVAVPGATPVTTPAVVTVATAGLLLIHVTVLLLALAGNTVAMSVSLPPTPIEVVDLFKVMPVGLINTTVTTQVADNPLKVVPVMVAVPADTPVTTPAVVTVATPGALLTQVTVLFNALAGVMVAVNVVDSLTLMVVDEGDMLIPVGTTLVTVIDDVAVKPFTVVAVMVAVPADTPVTSPVALTLATAGLLLTQVTA